MLRIAIIASLMIFTGLPVIAETRPPPELRAMNSLLFQCYSREANAVAHDVTLQDQIESLTKQVADLTRERDEMKAAPAK